MALKLLWTVLGALLVMWIVWVLLGGPARYEKQSGPFIRSPIEQSSGTTYGPTLSK